MLATTWWTFSTAWAKRSVFVGTKGTLELDRPFRPDGPAGVRLEAHRQVLTLEIPGDDCFCREIEHFAAVVRGQIPATITPGDSARWIAIAEEVEQQISAQQISAAVSE